MVCLRATLPATLFIASALQVDRATGPPIACKSELIQFISG
jgi:hypothetical protein